MVIIALEGVHACQGVALASYPVVVGLSLQVVVVQLVPLVEDLLSFPSSLLVHPDLELAFLEDLPSVLVAAVEELILKLPGLVESSFVEKGHQHPVQVPVIQELPLSFQELQGLHDQRHVPFHDREQHQPKVL